MKKLRAMLAFGWCACFPAVAQDKPSADECVRQLADDATKASARARLLELGADAVPALSKALSGVPTPQLAEYLPLLTELGAPAASALPALIELLRVESVDANAVMLAIAELAPFRPRDSTWTPSDVSRALLQRRVQRGMRWDADESRVSQRLGWRFRFPLAPDVPLLRAALRGHQPLRREVAIDHLRAIGRAGAAAAPDLVAILERPEPLVLGTDRTVPLHRKAAQALLAIGAEESAVQLARDVLAGTRPVPKRREEAVPDRARQRIAELVAELAQADRRAGAIANLVALGEHAAAPVGSLLAAPVDDDTMRAALGVLQALGRRGVAAVPQLHAALTTVRAEHLIAVIEALAVAAPWSYDLVPSLSYSGGVGRVTIGDVRVQGTIDVAFLNAFSAAYQALHTAVGVDPASTAVELAEFLQSPSVAMRERALAIARDQGAAARDLLPAVADMLVATQPKLHGSEWVAANEARTWSVDRTPHVQRLAAETIVAIAAADDPLVAKAREILARPAPEPEPDAGK